MTAITNKKFKRLARNLEGLTFMFETSFDGSFKDQHSYGSADVVLGFYDAWQAKEDAAKSAMWNLEEGGDAGAAMESLDQVLPE